LLWWKLGQRNAQVIGYRTLGFQMTSTSPARRCSNTLLKIGRPAREP
jgi:hypothetical protein